MTYKQKRIFATLISKISNSTNLDASIVMHFINTDLERIFHEGLQAHSLRLTLLDEQIASLTKRENALGKELREKEDALRATSSRVEAASASLKERSESLTRTLKEVDDLQRRLADLDSSLRAAARDKNKLRYDLMMKNHKRRESDDKSARLIRLLLAFFSLIAVAIAAALIWRLNK